MGFLKYSNPKKYPRVATPSACYRGPKPQKCPKWLGEGAKGVLDPESKGLPKPCFAPVQLSFAPVQEDFAALGPKHLLHPLLTTLGTFEVSGSCSRRLGSQPKGPNQGRKNHDSHRRDRI